MRIVFIGTGEIGVPTLRALLDSEHEIVAVVTQPDKPVGREQSIEPPPIKKALIGRARPPASAQATAGKPARQSFNPEESRIHRPLGRSAGLRPM